MADHRAAAGHWPAFANRAEYLRDPMILAMSALRSAAVLHRGGQIFVRRRIRLDHSVRPPIAQSSVRMGWARRGSAAVQSMIVDVSCSAHFFHFSLLYSAPLGLIVHSGEQPIGIVLDIKHMRRPHQVCGREVCFRLREAFQLARLVIKCQVVKAAPLSGCRSANA